MPGIRIVVYSDKSLAVVGETFPIKNNLRALGGLLNGKLFINGARVAEWIFLLSKRAELARSELALEAAPAGALRQRRQQQRRSRPRPAVAS